MVETISAPSGSQLVNVDTSAIANGTIYKVLSVEDLFQLVKNPTPELVAASNGITVARSAVDPNHFWIRLSIASLRWNTQPAWTIDSALGSDENPGTAAAPIRTAGELQRRVGSTTPLNQTTTITIARSLLATDFFSPDFLVGNVERVTFSGVPTVLATGTFTGVTAINRAAQQAQEVDDAALPGGFAPYVGRLLRITAGANAGATAVIVKSVDADTARTSRFVIAPTIYNEYPGTYVSPQVGDTYEILDLPILPVGLPSFRNSTSGEGPGFFPVVVLNLLKFSATTGFGVLQDTNQQIFATNCIFDRMTFECDAFASIGCDFTGTNFFFTGYSVGTINAGAVLDGLLQVEGGFVEFDFDVIGQNGGLVRYLNNSSGEVGTACAFDTVASNGAFVVDIGCVVRQLTQLDGTNALWGSQNAGHGLTVRSSGAYIYTNNKPNINGGLGAGREALVGGSDRQYAAQIPFVKDSATPPANLAMVVVFA